MFKFSFERGLLPHIHLGYIPGISAIVGLCGVIVHNCCSSRAWYPSKLAYARRIDSLWLIHGVSAPLLDMLPY